MIGAIIGDIVGSPYDFNNIKTKNFEFLMKRNHYTDDSVMTIAVADALMQYEKIDSQNVSDFKITLIQSMKRLGRAHYFAGYGEKFYNWLITPTTLPYNSFGNGSAMRVSPVAWYAQTLEEALFLAKATAEVTHNHPEGIKGAVVVAGATFLARNGALLEEIQQFVSKYYNIDFSLEDIRPYYEFDVTCQGSVPQALQAFFESTSFEDAIRNAISIGGDSDTIGAMTGAIADAYYGADKMLCNTALGYLTEDLRAITEKFILKYWRYDEMYKGTIWAKSNADFLNQTFGTNYKAFMRGRWNYSDNTWVWMVRMDGKVRQGWVNKIISDKEIHELYVSNDTPTYSNEPERKYRIVVQIIDHANIREYRLLGKYRFDFENSTKGKHILLKVNE